MVAGRIGALCRRLGHWVCGEESTSPVDVLAPRVGRVLPRTIALWHFSDGEDLFYGDGSHEELPFDAAHGQGPV